ncbi:MAG: polysaccharide biosynthesis/export family protein [Planctomycetota bacterium]|nr:MAG: polysaccharide biosynthesis/export family protein [Planctomycetota bacterium]
MKTARDVAVVCIVSIYLAGCGNRFFDPAQIGRFRPVPSVNVILDSLGVAEEEPSVWEGAEQPRPIDVMMIETDYMFRPGDIVRVSIFELLQEGAPFINDYVVTETGKLSIPEVGVVEAAGLSESQLEEEIRQILSPSVLKEPSVVVTLLSSEKRTFSIWGDGVARPSRYVIPRYDFRLTDAIATAGGVGQFNVSYLYVSRPVTGEEVITEPVEPELVRPAEPEELVEPEREMLEIIAPRAKRHVSGNNLVVASTEMITDTELAELALPQGFEPFGNELLSQTSLESLLESSAEQVGRETINNPINPDETGPIEWIFQDGRWIPIQVGRPKPTEPIAKVEPGKVTEPLREQLPEVFGWDQIGTGGVQRRVIKISADRLLSGDPRYNIVIRSGDSIHVPVDVIGEFVIMGNVNAQGYINLTGRPMTLKMAIAAAGGLGPLAWPKRCEVIRRIGRDKEEIVMVDLDKISRGEQPDFFIKPNDLVNVGTHPTSRWRAVLRNAFRATYGFGFVYDRNFADRDFGTRRPIPHWF